MNKDQKAAVIDGVAEEIEQSEAIVAVDYRGLSVKQAAELRNALSPAGASFRIVKNTLTERAADKAGAESLKELLEGPTALTFVRGDVALAAKALATFRRETGILAFKGGRLGDETLEIGQIEAIAKLPARDALNAQFVGVLASPVTTLVRGLNSLVAGLAVALSQIEQQGLLDSGKAGDEAAAEGDAGEPSGDAAQAEAEPQPEADAGEAEPAVEAAAEAERAAEAEDEVEGEPSTGGEDEAESGDTAEGDASGGAAAPAAAADEAGNANAPSAGETESEEG